MGKVQINCGAGMAGVGVRNEGRKNGEVFFKSYWRREGKLQKGWVRSKVK